MLRDRYQNRFLTMTTKRSIAYPARPAYVVNNCKYMVSRPMATDCIHARILTSLPGRAVAIIRNTKFVM